MAYLLVSFWLNFCYEWILPFSLFNHRRVWVGRDPEASWCHQQSWLVAVLQQKGFPRAISFRKNILAMLSESHLHHGFPEGCYRNLYVSILINILKEVLWVVGCALSKSSIGSRDNTGMTMKQLLLPASSSPPIHPSPCFYSTHHWEIWVLTRCAAFCQNKDLLFTLIPFFSVIPPSPPTLKQDSVANLSFFPLIIAYAYLGPHPSSHCLARLSNQDSSVPQIFDHFSYSSLNSASVRMRIPEYHNSY